MRKILTSIAVCTMLVAPGMASANRIIVQSTTSTQNSGLYDYLLPIIKKETGLNVAVVAVGTGQALKNSAKCDGDVVLVHAKKAEEKFIAAGYGLKRHPLMYNDFIIVGPKADPAHVAATKSATGALTAIARAKVPFISRGDDSGTNKKEIALWKAAGIDPTPASGKWYRESGSGMGATLNLAAGMGAYTLTDRGTWISFKNKADLVILSQGDKALFNQYGLFMVNPAHCPKVNVKDSKVFIDWLLSPHGQQVIASYRLHGKQLFHPDATK